MQSRYEESFDRDMGCTEAQWLGWLPAALGANAWQRAGSCVQVSIDDGHLVLSWQEAPPRVIALMQVPRLLVNFRFTSLDKAARYAFMKRFDLYMQRGGG